MAHPTPTPARPVDLAAVLAALERIHTRADQLLRLLHTTPRPRN